MCNFPLFGSLYPKAPSAISRISAVSKLNCLSEEGARKYKPMRVPLTTLDNLFYIEKSSNKVSTNTKKIDSV